MTTAPTALAAVLALGLATSSASLATSPAAGALLIEGRLAGETIRIVVDAEAEQAEVMVGRERHRVDLAADKAQRVAEDGRVSEEVLAPETGSQAPEIQPWGPGPTIAGHPSVYHVMSVGDEVCGEVLISPWMKPFVGPAVEALAILERVKGEGGIAPIDLDGPCGKLSFSSYAALGWPLMAGSVDRPIFETESIDFAYVPRAGELAWHH